MQVSLAFSNSQEDEKSKKSEYIWGAPGLKLFLGEKVGLGWFLFTWHFIIWIWKHTFS